MTIILVKKCIIDIQFQLIIHIIVSAKLLIHFNRHFNNSLLLMIYILLRLCDLYGKKVNVYLGVIL